MKTKRKPRVDDDAGLEKRQSFEEGPGIDPGPRLAG